MPGIRVVAVRSARRRPPSQARKLLRWRRRRSGYDPVEGRRRPLPSALPTSRTWSVNRWRPGPRGLAAAGSTRSWRGRQGAEKRCSPNASRNPPDLSASEALDATRIYRTYEENRPGLPSPPPPSGLTHRSPQPLSGGRKPAPAGRDLLRSLRRAFPRRILPNSAPKSGRRSGSRSESGEIRISRSGHRFSPVQPAAGGNDPCRCNAGHPRKVCRCPPAAPRPVLEKLWGPSSTGSTSRSPSPGTVSTRPSGEARGESSAVVRRRVEASGRFRRHCATFFRTNGTVRTGTAELLRELTPEAAAFLARSGTALPVGRAMGKRPAWRGRSPTSPQSGGRAPPRRRSPPVPPAQIGGRCR